MAVDMYLKLDKIEGESPDDKHKGEIEVLSWSWGATQSGTTHQGSGGGSGRVEVQDLTVTKFLDKSSPALFLHTCNGHHIPTAVLTLRKAGGAKALEYFKVTMENVIITSYRTGGSSSDDRVTESVTLNFGTAKVEYVPQNKDGGGLPSIQKGWDISANKDCGG